MYTRTNSGISNRAKFSGADFTVYVEGGGGVQGAGSSDKIFWGDLLSKLRPDLNFVFIARGGKPEIETIARKVKSGAIENTIVAMDADFDIWLGECIKHPRILYTYGYSWENDVFDSTLIEPMLTRLLKGRNIPSSDISRIKDDFELALEKLRPWVNADFWLRSMNSSLFPKINSGRFISNSRHDGSIKLNVKEIWKVFRSEYQGVARDKRTQRPSTWILSGNCFLHGHSMHSLMLSVVIYSFSLLQKKCNVTSDHLEETMMGVFCQNFDRLHSHKKEHFVNALSGIR